MSTRCRQTQKNLLAPTGSVRSSVTVSRVGEASPRPVITRIVDDQRYPAAKGDQRWASLGTRQGR